MILLLIPGNEIYTTQLKVFLALTLAAILMFAFENLNQTVVALLLPFLYIVLKVAPASVALSPWTQTVPWMMISGLILANVLQSIGLLKRVAYKCIVLTGGQLCRHYLRHRHHRSGAESDDPFPGAGPSGHLRLWHLYRSGL